MQIDIRSAHYIRVRFSGPTNKRGPRWSLSWENWSGVGGRVRRSIPYTSDRDDMARAVAGVFVDWLNTGANESGLDCRLVPERVTLASVSGDEWAVLVETIDERDKAARE